MTEWQGIGRSVVDVVRGVAMPGNPLVYCNLKPGHAGDHQAAWRNDLPPVPTVGAEDDHTSRGRG